VADRRYEDVDEVSVPSTSGVIAIEYHGLSFKTREDGMLYRYRLTGYEPEWQTTRKRRLEYSGLPRGTYRFEVAAIDRDMAYSKEPAILALTVHLPYGQIGLAAGLGIAVLLAAWQTVRIVRRDQRLQESNVALTAEAALERVRAKALGMQRSEDLGGVAEALFQEFRDLGLSPVHAGIYLRDRSRGVGVFWGSGSIWKEGYGEIPYDPSRRQHPVIGEVDAAEKRGDAYYSHTFAGQDLVEWEESVLEHLGWQDEPVRRASERYSQLVHYWVFFPDVHVGQLSMHLTEPLSETDLNAATRFAGLFALAYGRFLELQEKEARNQELEAANRAMSDANKELFAVNQALQRDRAVERIRSEVQAMDEAADFERILSMLSEDLRTVGLAFDSCAIDVLDSPVEHPTFEHFTEYGFRYTTYAIDPDGQVTRESYTLSAPFPDVNREMIERFIAGEAWHGRSQDRAILEVPAAGYGRVRITSSERDHFGDEDIESLGDFASAIALGYARYLDIREIQEQTQRKSAFLASMSHELRTPMNAIRGFTDLVLRRIGDSIPDRHRGNLEKVIQASDHLLAMINDLLDLSKIEAGRMDVNPERFDVKALVSSCCATVSPLLAEKPDVKLDFHVPDDVGEAHTDQARVRQMVINLLSNAIKFTESGTVEVRVSRGESAGEGTRNTGDRMQEKSRTDDGPQTTDDGRQEQDQLEIVVADTGKGIPADELATIFDEYRQVKGTEAKGTGLGLSITRRFTALLGGTIGVESQEGKGSTFTVRIPSEYGG